MKIYKPYNKVLVRIQVTQYNEKTEYLTLCETTRKDVLDFCAKIINSQNLPNVTKGKRTSINVRDAIGGKNLKSESISFYGLKPKQVINLIKKQL